MVCGAERKLRSWESVSSGCDTPGGDGKVVAARDPSERDFERSSRVLDTERMFGEHVWRTTVRSFNPNTCSFVNH